MRRSGRESDRRLRTPRPSDRRAQTTGSRAADRRHAVGTRTVQREGIADQVDGLGTTRRGRQRRNVAPRIRARSVLAERPKAGHARPRRAPQSSWPKGRSTATCHGAPTVRRPRVFASSCSRTRSCERPVLASAGSSKASVDVRSDSTSDWRTSPSARYAGSVHGATYLAVAPKRSPAGRHVRGVAATDSRADRPGGAGGRSAGWAGRRLADNVSPAGGRQTKRSWRHRAEKLTTGGARERRVRLGVRPKPTGQGGG